MVRRSITMFAVRAKPPPGFMNVDLEIVSRSKLDEIESALSDTAHALYSGAVRRGVFLLALECNAYPKDADAAIVALCDAVDRLGTPERRIWKRALRRTFDVGYRLAHGDAAVRVSLEPTTLSRVISVGATVAFTCYRDDDSEPGSPGNAAGRRA